MIFNENTEEDHYKERAYLSSEEDDTIWRLQQEINLENTLTKEFPIMGRKTFLASNIDQDEPELIPIII